MNKLMLIAAMVFLAACESEESCYRNTKANSNSVNAHAQLVLIYVNEDMNACDYTILGDSVVRR